MLIVRKGEEVDDSRIREFIGKSEAFYEKDSLFILVENTDKKMIGVVGVQIFDDIGLLRSFVFSSDFPVEKLPIFLERILVVAKESKCQFLYLATNKLQGIPLFQTFGFSEVEVEELPKVIKLSTDRVTFSKKDSITFMWKTL